MQTYGLLSNNTSVPLARREIQITLRPTGANICEKLLFMNMQKNDIETEFRYPMKKGRVNGLRFRVEDGDWQLMTVEEKVKAENKYNEAVTSGNQAALGSQLNDDVFSIKVGRLQPFELIWIEVNLYSELDWTDCYSYRHQMTMFPPYIMDEASISNYESKAPKFSEGELPYGIFTSFRFENTNPFTVDIVSDEIQKDLKSGENNTLDIPRTKISGTTDITVQMYPSQLIPSVNFTENDNYLYLQFSCGHNMNNIGVASVVADKMDDEQLKNVLAQYEVIENHSETKPEDKKYVFVVDGSGSMGGSCIENASQALRIAIKQLPQNAQYMILVFGDNNDNRKNVFYPLQANTTTPNKKGYHPNYSCDGCNSYPIEGKRYHMKGDNDVDFDEMCFKATGKPIEKFDVIDPTNTPVTPDVTDKWVKHTDESFKHTLEWIEQNVSADYGGTEMAIAVDSVYQQLSPSDKNVIIMLTDAGIWGGQDVAIVEKVKKSEVKAEVFGLGIGSSCSMSFLEKFSNVGNGVSFHVSNSEDINDRTQRLMNCATQSQYLRNISFEVPDYVTINTKKPITSYFFGEPMNVFCQVEKSKFKGDEVLNIKSGDHVFMSLPFNKMVPSSVDLEMAFHMTYLEQLLKFPELYKNSIEYNKVVIDIATKYNIVTQFTSAVVVRELTNADGNKTLEKVDIPIAIGKDKQNYQPEYPDLSYCAFAFNAPLSYSADSFQDARGRCSDDEEECMGDDIFDCDYSTNMFRGINNPGINTVGSVLKNKNLDLRSEIVMPINPVNPYQPISNVFSNTNNFELGLNKITENEKPSTYKTKEQQPSQRSTLTVKQLVEKIVLAQLSNGSWDYDTELLQQLAKQSVDVYRKELGMASSDDVFMTLMVMAFLNNHPEFYSTYNKSYKNAEKYVSSVISDVKKDTLTLVKVGFN